MAAVLEELGSKLTDIAGIKVSFPVKEDKDFILKIYARLCLMYDETWDCGNASISLSCKKILRLLNRVGIAHLTPTAADVVDPRRLPRVWSAFISHLEQKYGSQGLYPRLRKVLKQQQILAARREAERERQQRLAGLASSPCKSHPGDVSTCSTLSQDSQEDVRFVKPRPPVFKPRDVSVLSAPSASPGRGAVRSRIPVPTKQNVIPTGKQLARTPSVPPSKGPPAAGQPQRVQMFGSPRLVAPKAAAALTATAAAVPAAADRSPPSPCGRSDSGASESASSTDASPGRRRSLIPAPKTPEQALGEYIESVLNTDFPHSAAEKVSEPAAETTLNVTYSAERPVAPAGREAGPAPSPAADARDAILQAAEDKENVQPAPVEELAAKAADAPKDVSPRDVRRDTYEVAPAAETAEKGDGDAPSSAPPQQDAAEVPQKARAKKGPSKKNTAPAAVEAAPAPEPGPITQPVQNEEPAAPAPDQSEQEPTVVEEQPGKRRHDRSKKDAPDSEQVETADQEQTAPKVSKKRSARAKKVEAALQDPSIAEVAPAVESASAVENPVESVSEPVPIEPKTEAPKKRGGRPKKERKVPSEVPLTNVTEDTVASEEGGSPQLKDSTACDAEVTNPAESKPVEPKTEAPKKRGGRPKKEKQAASEAPSEPEVTAVSEDGPAPQPAEPGVCDAKLESVVESTPVEPNTEAPKKRGGRSKKDKQAANEAPFEESVSSKEGPAPQPAEQAAEPAVCDANLESVVESTPIEPETEAPKKLGSRPKKGSQPESEVRFELPTASEDGFGPQSAESAVRDSEPTNAAESTSIESKTGASKKRDGRSKKGKQAASEKQSTNVTEVPVVSEEGASSHPTEPPCPPVCIAEESTFAEPKKRRGRSKKERQASSEAPPMHVPEEPATSHPAESPIFDAEVTSVVESKPAEPKTEATKKRVGRSKKGKRATSEEVSTNVTEVTVASDEGPVAQPTETAVCDAKLTAAPESTSTPTEPQSEQAAPAAEELPKRRRTRAANSSSENQTTSQESVLVEPASAEEEAPKRRRGRAKQAKPEETAEPEPEPAAGRSRGRRTRHTEPQPEPEGSGAESENVPAAAEETQRPTRRRESRTSAAAAADAPAAAPAGRRSTRGAQKAAEPERESSAEVAPRRRRRLCLIVESDSDGSTPPASAEPSPAWPQPQRTRRTRKAAEHSDRPRRALRALENCD
ncbi:proteoglycan 4-like [Amphibalanus amphitrite]|uniref:proteoglycan 4-like n=1 Tax=Amphibalanus amphitrite TaxID=1232801 RepID=UPI001C91EE20|nr:proteoglycan 4-like [Amphibalanus amphitrite]